MSVGGPTIAEGIAVRDIGEMPFEIVRRRVTDVLVVPERAVEEAIGLLVEGAKTVAEGAGAAGVAALLTFPERFRGKRVGVAITGGNIDARILSNVLLRNLLRDGRLLRLHLQIPDRPGRAGRHRRQDRRRAAATSSRSRTSACSPPHRCRRRSWRSWWRRAIPRTPRRSSRRWSKATWCGECSAERKQQLEPQMSGRLLAPQTWKLSPQPQRPFSFGLAKVKPDASDFVS